MQIVESFRNIFRIEELRKRILITLFMLFIFRVGAHIALPGVNSAAVEAIQSKSQGGDFGSVFAMIEIFTGGAFANMALFALGIMPYITSSIIMQLMTKVSPKLEAMAKEGPAGQRRISQYTRWLTLPVCILQAFMGVQSLNSPMMQQFTGGQPLVLETGAFTVFMMVSAMTAGALFVMWLGEQITEHGIGNGASILIMSGIVARLPVITQILFKKADSGVYQHSAVVTIYLVWVAAIFAIVFITQAQRRIPLQNAKHIRGGRVFGSSRNFLPLKVNTAGVMPVIFASSLLIIPQLIGMIPHMQWFSDWFFRGNFVFSLIYILMIFGFSYFWTYLFFRPQEMANNLKEYGSFIPGIRPGEHTAAYLDNILSKVTLCGAAFLCAIALLPDMIGNGLGLERYLVTFVGGTGILIVVGVCLDVMQKIESHLLLHHYEGFVGPGRMRGRR